jgi:HAD superfamily hydrolase (TIGR01490 family)
MNLCLFDLDHTLLPIDSDHSWGEFIISQGWADPVEFARQNDQFYGHYQAGTLDIHAYVEFTTRPWRNRSESEMQAAHAKFMHNIIIPAMHPQAIELVRQHHAQGDLVAMVTATNEFVTAPIAKAFGIEHLIAVRLERNATGHLTGRIDGIPSFREGKIVRTQQWLLQQGQVLNNFEKISVYSDSANDLPLLEIATHAVATNPSPSLQTIALERGWRILELFA